MSLRRGYFALGLLCLLLMASSVQAELLGLQPSFPVCLFNSSGTLTYDAASDAMLMDSRPLAVRFSPTTFPCTVKPTTAGGECDLKISVQVDSTGALAGGTTGNDLILIGAVDQDGDGTYDYDGVLLSGEVVQFGYLDSSATVDTYDFRFAVTGGSLSNYYYGGDIAVRVTSESSNFANDFTVSFAGGAKGILGPVNSACALELAIEACVQIPPPPPTVSDCDGKVISMGLKYTGLGCEATSHTQRAKKVSCVGDPGLAEPVSVLVTDKKGKKVWASQNGVSIGDIVLVEAANAKKKKLSGETKVSIFNAEGALIQETCFQTSCSEPLNVGDQFGSMRLVSITSNKGGTVVEEPEDPDLCITEIPAVTGPHCQGQVRTLRLRYTGAGPSATNHTQDPSKVACSGDAGSASPVRIVITNDNDDEVFLDTGTDASVTLGEVVDVVAQNGGQDVLGSVTKAKIYDKNGGLLEDIYFHTSCSQPLNLGDRFSSLEVFGMDTTEASVVIGMPVLYTYTITNNSDIFPLTNVGVVDDVIGLIPGSPVAWLGPGETVVLSTTQWVSEETTSTAVVTGYIGLGTCEDMASVTITKAEPPVGLQECTSKIKALLLEYTGPAVAGACVSIVADKAWNTPVVYSDINLTAGMILSSPTENGFSVDAEAHNCTDLGSKISILINSSEEVIHTSCSTPLVRGEAAPLNDPKGDPSPNWRVVEFTQKN